MTRRFTGARAEEQAEAYAATLDDLDPRVGRCGHPKHRLTAEQLEARLRGRGIVRPCPCASADEPERDCPYVTWRRVPVVRLASGVVVVPGVGGPDPDPTLAELDDGAPIEPPRRASRPTRAARTRGGPHDS